MQTTLMHKGQAALWVTNGCTSMSKPINTSSTPMGIDNNDKYPLNPNKCHALIKAPSLFYHRQFILTCPNHKVLGPKSSDTVFNTLKANTKIAEFANSVDPDEAVHYEQCRFR